MYYCDAGGVVGLLAGGTEDKKTEAINLKNTGNVYGKGPMVGGIVGCTNDYNKIENCENRGNVIGESDQVSGISGAFNRYSSMNNCRNYGNVEGKGYETGGICGTFNYKSVLSKRRNSGTITGKEKTGGIIGVHATKQNITDTTIEECYNDGNVYGTTNVGGIIGKYGGKQGTVTKCYNKGIITGTSEVGEIIGAPGDITWENTFSKLFYLANSGGLTALGWKADDTENKIQSTDQDLTYEQFTTWIEAQ